jgi:cytochrome d ubiquinol oxidase subunit I
VAEYGRQPWVVEGVLPTFLGVSAVSRAAIIGSLAGFVLFYSILAAIDVMLMMRTIRQGPTTEDPLEQDHARTTAMRRA